MTKEEAISYIESYGWSTTRLGLERTQEYFDGMEHLLSGLPFFYHELNELNEFSMQNIMIMMHLRCNALGFLALASVSLRRRATAFTKAIAD